MQTLRKQTILSSIFIMLGYCFGAITVLLYTKFNFIDKGYVGLTKVMMDFGALAFAFCSLGFNPVLYKFYPYFEDNLPKKKNELFTISFVLSLIGFFIFCIVGYFAKPFVVDMYIKRSPLIVENYIYLFIYAFGMLVFCVLETYGLVKHTSSLTNFLKETVLRFISVMLIVIVGLFVLPSQYFIIGFSFAFYPIDIFLFLYLIRRKDLHFHFHISNVTIKYKKKMIAMACLIFSGFVIMTLTQVLDGFIIGKLMGQNFVADFGLAQYGANFVSVPQKAILGASIGVLVVKWKQKDMNEIKRIYNRSCINLSLMSLFIFGLIWLNAVPLIDYLKIDAGWKTGINTMFFICLARAIDASTGLNSIIIGTSTFWKFEFITATILLAIRMPTAWFFIQKFGLIGSAYSDVISISIFNLIRFEFLRRRFGMQPFNYKNVLAILLAVSSYYLALFTGNASSGLTSIILQTLVFCLVFILGIFSLNLTPDAMQLYNRWIKGVKEDKN